MHLNKRLSKINLMIGKLSTYLGSKSTAGSRLQGYSQKKTIKFTKLKILRKNISIPCRKKIYPQVCTCLFNNMPYVLDLTRVFLPILGTWLNPQNWEFFKLFYTKLGKTHTVWYNQIKHKIKTKKHTSHFFVPWIGNFLLEIGKKTYFLQWEHDSISVAKMVEKNLLTLMKYVGMNTLLQI